MFKWILNEELQSAYKASHSCEKALIRLQDDMLKAIDSHRGVLLLLLDLSAAFDTVDHEIQQVSPSEEVEKYPIRHNNCQPEIHI